MVLYFEVEFSGVFTLCIPLILQSSKTQGGPQIKRKKKEEKSCLKCKQRLCANELPSVFISRRFSFPVYSIFYGPRTFTPPFLFSTALCHRKHLTSCHQTSLYIFISTYSPTNASFLPPSTFTSPSVWHTTYTNRSRKIQVVSSSPATQHLIWWRLLHQHINWLICFLLAREHRGRSGSRHSHPNLPLTLC